MDTQILGHYIGGEWTGTDGTLESRNPSNTDEIVARFPDGGDDEVARAVAAAKEAQPGWAQASPEVRSDVLRKAGEGLFARSAEIGELLAREEGKTRAEGVGETLRAARILLYFAGEALRRHGQTLESTRPGLDVATYREALGVVGLITPWNFPIAIPAWKAAPALAFGNTVVLKPANITSAVAAALTQVLHDAGVPPGVFNLVLGRGRVGQAIVDHRDVAAVSFTGSQGVGASVAKSAVARQARVQLEMGGKNPLVVLADCERQMLSGSSDALYSAFENVIRNALAYTQDGTTVTVRLLRDPRDPRHALVTVRDHGPGVAEAELKRIFEPFYRTDSARTRASGGTGLGLAIARSAVEWHGGTICARNADGGGLEVTIRLPTARA